MYLVSNVFLSQWQIMTIDEMHTNILKYFKQYLLKMHNMFLNNIYIDYAIAVGRFSVLKLTFVVSHTEVVISRNEQI